MCTTGHDVVTWRLRADSAAAVVALTLSVADLVARYARAIPSAA